jgi:hypothetical protein
LQSRTTTTIYIYMYIHIYMYVYIYIYISQATTAAMPQWNYWKGAKEGGGNGLVRSVAILAQKVTDVAAR